MKLATPEKIAVYRGEGHWGDKTVYDWFRAAVRARKDAIAAVDPSNRDTFTDGPARRVTWRALDQDVDRLTAALVHEGLGRDDIVIVQMPNTVDLLAVYMAAARLGVVLSPIPVQFGRHELAHVVATLQPRAILAASRFKERQLVRDALTVVGEAGSSASVLAWGEECPRGAVNLSAAARHPFDLDAIAIMTEKSAPSADDCFTLCWTSGTTGDPKAVPRSHNHWTAIAPAAYDALGVGPGDVLLNPFPLTNMAAIGGLMMSWLMSQGTLVLHHPLDLGVFLAQLEHERVNITVAPPAVLTMLLKKPELLEGRNLNALRAVGSGSAPLSAYLVSGWAARGVEVVNLFGSNEGVSLATGPMETSDPQLRATCFPRFGDPSVTFENRMHRRVSCRLVSLTTGEEILTPGVMGELRVKGPAVFEGYFGPDGAGPDVFDEQGYFRTGDLFEIAADDRFLAYKGREKDLIIRGGVNISAGEIDTLLDGLPGIVEIAVYPAADEVMGERVAAAVVLEPGATLDLGEIATWLMEKGVAPYKIPESLSTIDALPRNAMGKVLRWRIPDLLAQAESRAASAEAAE